mmetsp:Transcript_16839/g.34206  ORF Transcript_16839/g.34206 Transcript_16839/m.34206 type:complete len:118 (-) Transcript_16839:253-606(-)
MIVNQPTQCLSGEAAENVAGEIGGGREKSKPSFGSAKEKIKALGFALRVSNEPGDTTLDAFKRKKLLERICIVPLDAVQDECLQVPPLKYRRKAQKDTAKSRDCGIVPKLKKVFRKI